MTMTEEELEETTTIIERKLATLVDNSRQHTRIRFCGATACVFHVERVDDPIDSRYECALLETWIEGHGKCANFRSKP